MDLNAKLVAAAHAGGYLGDLTDSQKQRLEHHRWARHVETTGRWILTDAGHAAAQQVEADQAAGETRPWWEAENISDAGYAFHRMIR